MLSTGFVSWPLSLVRLPKVLSELHAERPDAGQRDGGTILGSRRRSGLLPVPLGRAASDAADRDREQGKAASENSATKDFRDVMVVQASFLFLVCVDIHGGDGMDLVPRMHSPYSDLR